MVQTIKSAVFRHFSQIRSFFPTSLPTGMTAFNKWMQEVLELAGPIADKNSMIWLISNEIMHVKSGVDRIPKRYFVKVLRKFAANQLAAATVNDLKAKQETAQKAALEQQKAEDTAKQAVPNAQKINT